MRRTYWLPAAVFASAMVAHTAYLSRDTRVDERVECIYDVAGRCVEDRVVRTERTALSTKGFARYLRQQDYFLGFSYALAFAFAAYALTQLRRHRRRAAAGAIAGFSLGSVLLVAGCILVGCCGSPMLAVWISVLGAKAFGLAKPLVAGLTALSVAAGVYCLRRGCSVDCCSPPTSSDR